MPAGSGSLTSMIDPSAPTSDPRQEWLDRWQGHEDREALDRLLRCEIEALAERLRRRMGAGVDPGNSASDLVQEAVWRLLRREGEVRFDSPGQLRAYLWKVAWNLFLDVTRRPGLRVRHLAPAESASLSAAFARTGGLGSVEQEDQRTALSLAVNLLPSADAQVLELVYLQGSEIGAAAQQLGLSRAAFDMRLTRARRRLAEKLVDWSELIG